MFVKSDGLPGSHFLVCNHKSWHLNTGVLSIYTCCNLLFPGICAPLLFESLKVVREDKMSTRLAVTEHCSLPLNVSLSR